MTAPFPAVKTTKKPSNLISLYGCQWSKDTNPVQREIIMLRKDGHWIGKDGQPRGLGREFHFRKLQELLYGDAKVWHRWNELQMRTYIPGWRTIGVIGPKSSGKTFSAATDVLADYYVWPECTSVLVTTTTRESLENRVWGELKKYHQIARSRWPDLPGHVIDGRQRIVTHAKDLDSDIRDLRNGLIGMAIKRGNEVANIADFAGLKNKRVRVLADELSHFPKSFVDIISNLDANPDFIFFGLGNPKETTDALGYLCEPATHLGGWEGGIDQRPGTKTWELRRPQGICIHLPGDDSPNLDGKMNIPLITQEMMDRDEKFYGKDSWQYQMMNLGRMPRGQGSRRVLTRQMCMKFGAMNPPIWQNHLRKKIAFLDAAYRGVGGDRCIFGTLEFGEQSDSAPAEREESALAQPFVERKKNKIILALTSLVNVPIENSETELPEDQIVKFVKDQCIAQGIPPEDFFFDAGMRTSLVTAFSRLWSPNVESVDCGGRPTDQAVSAESSTPACEYYSKFITELWYAVRLMVESGQMRGLTEEALFEFCVREWKIVGANKIELESKADMKIKTGRSPDLADSIAIGIFGARQMGFVISKLGGNLESGNAQPDWHRRLKKMASSLKSRGRLQTA